MRSDSTIFRDSFLSNIDLVGWYYLWLALGQVLEDVCDVPARLLHPAGVERLSLRSGGGHLQQHVLLTLVRGVLRKLLHDVGAGEGRDVHIVGQGRAVCRLE